MFIACCQNEPFNITDSNVFSLHQLSNQYEVPELNKLTCQYISENKKPLIFESIFYKLQNKDSMVNIDLSEEEEIISLNFFEYINNEQLFSLPIHVLYQIVSNERLKLNSMNLTNQGQFIDFLFKCLDKYKREASILFLNLDLENERIGILSRLLADYSDTFDFNFFNPKFLSKSASILLSEIQKLKIEYSNKISEIEAENQKQKDFFILSQQMFDKSKNELEQRMIKFEEEQRKQMQQMQQELNDVKRKLERYTSIKVSKIEINMNNDNFAPGSTVTFTRVVEPEYAFNDGVKWQINQEDEGTVEIKSKDDKKLVLKIIKTTSKKVTIIASALDGSGVTASKEIKIGQLISKIDVNVLQNQLIKGKIEIKEEGSSTLDRSKSKYILNSSNSAKLGNQAYDDGEQLNDLVKEVTFQKERGEYYLHVLVVDNWGSSEELVSKKLVTNGSEGYRFGCTESVQSVELSPGKYKIEAWGAQGGSLNDTYHGGYGGYSTGTIDLKSKTTLFVCVGKSPKSTDGGYNGGGSGRVFKSNYIFTTFGGGGASHVGLKNGELSAFQSDYSSQLLIVASGGGGAVDGTEYNNKVNRPLFSTGGCGGGFTGDAGSCTYGNERAGAGATQTSPGKAGGGYEECGSFGYGANADDHGGHPGAGGGSGLYGGGSGGNSGPGGGGSGYINISKLTDAYMYGFEVQTSSEANSKTFSTTNVSPDSISNYAKKGDGYIKITPI
ncbi:hypothetical protein M9Y10_023904 [Tritrichomonas musculus]|uniref:receptor protein-tyrosine kinase n=1 Tax=Tritrichomonas musculus TaxID=1915356 RepID=A0ABR2KWG4_9EUKA